MVKVANTHVHNVKAAHRTVEHLTSQYAFLALTENICPLIDVHAIIVVPTVKHVKTVLTAYLAKKDISDPHVLKNVQEIAKPVFRNQNALLASMGGLVLFASVLTQIVQEKDCVHRTSAVPENVNLMLAMKHVTFIALVNVLNANKILNTV